MKARELLLITCFLMVLSACSSVQEQHSVKVAVLPVLDALPLHVALEQGYFSDQGLEVDLVPVASAPERDSLMQAGQVDAIINEIVSTLFYNQADTQVVIVRFLRVASDQYPLFRILAAPNSGITTVEDLKGVEIGISEGTVIHYTTDRLLTNAGLTAEEIATIAVPKIPDRIALLSSGELLAANLPDPAASAALLQGAVVVVDDTTLPEISSSVLTFNSRMAAENPTVVQGFLIAIEQAVEDINADKNTWLDLMLEKGLLPPPLADTYTIPDFPPASIPSEAQFADALEWALELELIPEMLDYQDSVSGQYLP
jgi:NitT/TauT family transport system substrate-binding protein